jgi:hypothetical protein
MLFGNRGGWSVSKQLNTSSFYSRLLISNIRECSNENGVLGLYDRVFGDVIDKPTPISITGDILLGRCFYLIREIKSLVDRSIYLY